MRRKGSGKRQTPIGREGCMWSAYIKHYKTPGFWKFVLKKDEHSHLKLDGNLLPTNRRRKRTQGDLMQRMRQLCKIRKLTALDISRRLRDEFPGCDVVPQDVHNERHLLRMEIYGTRNGTQLFFSELQELGAIGKAAVRMDHPIVYSGHSRGALMSGLKTGSCFQWTSHTKRTSSICH